MTGMLCCAAGFRTGQQPQRPMWGSLKPVPLLDKAPAQLAPAAQPSRMAKLSRQVPPPIKHQHRFHPWLAANHALLHCLGMCTGPSFACDIDTNKRMLPWKLDA